MLLELDSAGSTKWPAPPRTNSMSGSCSTGGFRSWRCTRERRGGDAGRHRRGVRL